MPQHRVRQAAVEDGLFGGVVVGQAALIGDVGPARTGVGEDADPASRAAATTLRCWGIRTLESNVGAEMNSSRSAPSNARRRPSGSS